MIEVVDASRVEATAVAIVAFGETPPLLAHLRDSERFLLVFFKERLLGVFGAGRPTLMSEMAYVWFIETPQLANHPTAFLRGVARVRDILLANYPQLVGLSFEERSVRWLEWLGAVFGPVMEQGGRAFVFRRIDG